MRRTFQFSDLIPDLDRRGMVGWWIGFAGLTLILVGLHFWFTPERQSRRQAAEKDNKGSYTQGDVELTSPNDWDDAPRVVKPRGGRFCYIDVARGLTVCFVTFFHYVWNLRHNYVMPNEPRIRDGHELFLQIIEFWIFFGVSFLWLSEAFHTSAYLGYIGFALVTAVCIMWHYWAAQASGVGMIMFTIGLSSYVQNCDGLKWGKIFGRIKKLFVIALGITVVTYALMPHEFVYFGAIHCITLVSILHLPFLKFPQWAVLGTVFIFSYKAFIGDFFLEVPVFRSTVDHMAWFLNLGYVLLGVFCGHMGLHKATHYVRCLWGGFKPGIALEDTVFVFLGRHSLLIFVMHQVVLFPLVKLLTGHSLLE